MFLDNKYTKWYFSIINRAKIENRIKRKNTYYESHHIVPKCMNGNELVLLTGKEHYVCHLLLCRMTTGNNKHKMINALIKMSFSKSKGQSRHSSISYSLVRSLIAEKNREMFKGIPKSDQAKSNMKGRSGKWVRKDIHKERMRGENNPMFGKVGKDNPAFRTEVRKKISSSKIGRKRVYREDGSHYYMKGK